VGTGSGIIPVSIAARIRDVLFLATDVSSPALEVARSNARKHQLEDRIQFVQCDLLPDQDKVGKQLDLLCANLPYIPTATLQHLPVYGREPTLALDGGQDGLEHIGRLLKRAPGRLAPGACILLEIESSLGSQTAALAEGVFPEARVEVHRDLADHDRLLEINL
jgi:release factor glutamine methyltransferase